MSDYLNNLAARSAGRAEQFRPRLPSLFEPVSGRTGPSSISRFQLEDTEIGRTEDAEGSANQGEQPSDAGASNLPVRGAMLGRQRAHFEEGPDSFQQSTTRTSAAAHQAVENAEPGGEARLPKRQRPPGDEIEARAASPGESSDSSFERHEEKPDSRSSARAETANTEHGRSVLTRQARMPGRIRNYLRPVNQGVKVKAPTGVAGQSLDQRIDQVLKRDHSPFGREYSSTEFETIDSGPIENEPATTTYSEAADLGERRAATQAPLRPQPASTIKVTIGRVEVRAIVNGNQPQRPESIIAKPRMTLDEYLKQRNGGNR